MKIIYPYFQNSATDYARLRNVFEKSARRHMPDAELVCVELESAQFLEDKHDLTTRAFLAKTEKILSTEYEYEFIVCDCDLLFANSILYPFAKMRAQQKYVAVTVREDFKYPYNTGIFFVERSYESKRVLDLWARNTKIIAANRYTATAKKAIKEQGGIDQAALEVTHQAHSKEILTLPCRVYNACQGDWKYTTDDTKVYHIKSGLRKIVLDPKKESGELYLKSHTRVQEIARMWWAEENR